MKKFSSTKLQSDGAEFLVLGHLLVRGVEAHKTYTGTAGHDVVAVNGEARKACRIQVKARTWVDSDKGFPIKNFSSEFVVNVRLNKGYEGKAAKELEFYVIPTSVVQSATVDRATEGGNFSKCMLKNIDNVEQYRDAWQLIETFLGAE